MNPDTKNSNNNIPSLQSVSNENITYNNEDKDNNISQNMNKNQISHRNISKKGNIQNFTQNTYEDQNMMGANPLKKKVEQQSISIVPGYKNFVLDENNAAYDSIADMFTKDEIEQAFKIIDYRMTGQITSEQLTFFLESIETNQCSLNWIYYYIGEQAKPEEIEEMIKMCDPEGYGYVTKDEFIKLASGQSLAPIGQAFPPTEEMLKKKELIENLNLEEFQLQKNKMNMNMNQQGNNTLKSKKNMQTTTTMNVTQNNDFTMYNASKDNTKLNIKNTNNVDNEMSMRQKSSNLNITTNANLNNTIAANKTNVQQTSSYSLQLLPKKDLQNKMKQFTKWQKDNKINPDRLLQLTKQINDIQRNNPDDEVEREFQKDYRDFLKFFGLQDSPQNQEIFKLGQSMLPEQNQMKIDIYLLMFIFISSQDINSSGKYGLAFQMIGKEIISFEDLIFIEKRLTLSDNISEDKIRTKFMNHKNKKEYKSKTYGAEEMDRQFFLDLVTSYPTCFQV